jgi:sulfur-carrier protein adenylyltransferase/sulfurtransferase
MQVAGFRFPESVQAVEAWLEEAGQPFAAKVVRVPSNNERQWILDVSELGYPIQTVKLSLGLLFPAIPCELFVDKALCLRLPHVEADGRLCLGEVSQSGDFDDPVAAVARAFQRFKIELLELSTNEDWKSAHLHQERLAYWNRFCSQQQKSPRGRPRPNATHVQMDQVDLWSEGRIAAYIPSGTRHRKIDCQIVAMGTADPVELARRHGLSSGTLIKGRAVFVRLPADLEWTPSKWPKDFRELNALVYAATGGEHTVAKWLQDVGWLDKSECADEIIATKRVPGGTMPLLVVLCHGRELYGYQILQATVSLVTIPHAAPIQIARIDPAWSMTRDHQLERFRRRQEKRVLVLGCGSLGSPLIDVLARSGIGKIDIVDSQAMASENVSRHLLGISSVRINKALAIAARLKKDIPGGEITGFCDDARHWVSANCQPGRYDLVVDCTAESSVRTFFARTRGGLFGDVPLIHAWVEPFCAASHVVATTLANPWPSSDPVAARVNAADYSDATVRVNLPACSDGFHPYGSADILQAAGFAAERVLAVLDGALDVSTVWSFVRAKAFFDELALPIKTNSLVPLVGTACDGVLLTRLLSEVLSAP